MQGQYLEVLVEFLDGREPLKRTMPVQFPAGKEQAACMQLLAAINQTGGLLDFDETSCSLIPISTMKQLHIKAPAVALADLGDLSRVTRSPLAL